MGGREEGLEDLSPILQKGVVNQRLVGGLSADMNVNVITVLGLYTHFQV